MFQQRGNFYNDSPFFSNFTSPASQREYQQQKEIQRRKYQQEIQRRKHQQQEMKRQELQILHEKKLKDQRKQKFLNSILLIQKNWRGYQVRKQNLVKKSKQISTIQKDANSLKQDYSHIIEILESEDICSLDELNFPEIKKIYTDLITFEEFLIKLLLSLDDVSTGGSETIRNYRKSVVSQIEKTLHLIDSFKNQIKALFEEKEIEEKNKIENDKKIQKEIDTDFEMIPEPQNEEEEEDQISCNDFEIMEESNISQGGLKQNEEYKINKQIEEKLLLIDQLNKEIEDLRNQL